jgi:hypothetical protein
MGFYASGAGQKNNHHFCKAKHWFGLDKQRWTLVHNFNKIFSINIGCRRTEC